MTTTFIENIVLYHQEIKTSLFVSGFTLGSFLFSMKSVIIKTMKEEIYDKDDYKKDIEELKDIGGKEGYYDSLQRFSNLLFWAISLSFVSALSNITLAFLGNIWTTSLCLFVTIVAWGSIGKTLYHFQKNWAKVFEYAENKANEKYRQKKGSDSK